MLGPRHRPRRTFTAVIAVVTIALALASGPGTIGVRSAYADDTQRVVAEITQPTPAVRSGDAVQILVTVSLTAPAEYLEVRLRLRTPQGRLIYQKTEIRSEVVEGRHVITFERPVDNPALSQGRYPVEVRVLASGSEPTNASGHVLVLDRDAAPQKVAIVARTWATPAVDRDGRFTDDPATQTGVRDDLSFIADLSTSRRAPISIIAPPLLLEELGRVSEGYQTIGADEPVTADSDVPSQAATTLRLLGTAREGGLLTLVDTPYATPDLAGLTAADAASDLDLHWSRADSVLAATLGSTTSPATAYLGRTLTNEAVAALSRRGATRLITPQRSLITTDAEAASGVHPLGGTGIIAIVPDDDASAAVDLGPTEFYDVMFDRVDTGPVTLMMDVGLEGEQGTAGIEQAIEMIDAVDWLELVPLDTLDAPEGTGPVRVDTAAESTAPHAYWGEVAAAREAVNAYREAVADDDADAESLSRMLLVAESGLWAGADDAWAHSERGREITGDIEGFVTGQFGQVAFEAKDVTLSGNSGAVPLTLANNTGKHLTLTVTATFKGADEGQVSRTVEVDPMENFITIPVDLRNSMTSELHVVARSGERVVAETTLTLRTSYIDRLAVLAMVVLVLLVLLALIRRRVRASNAVTIGDEAPDAPDPIPSDEQ